MLDVEFAQLSDPGRVRDHNEDYWSVYCPETPEQARTQAGCLRWRTAWAATSRARSRPAIAVERSDRRVSQDAAPARRTRALLPRWCRPPTPSVYEAGARGGSGRHAMATTMVACALRFDRVVVAHVGDSRCYLIRRGPAHRADARSHGGQ